MLLTMAVGAARSSMYLAPIAFIKSTAATQPARRRAQPCCLAFGSDIRSSRPASPLNGPSSVAALQRVDESSNNLQILQKSASSPTELRRVEERAEVRGANAQSHPNIATRAKHLQSSLLRIGAALLCAASA